MIQNEKNNKQKLKKAKTTTTGKYQLVRCVQASFVCLIKKGFREKKHLGPTDGNGTRLKQIIACKCWWEK